MIVLKEYGSEATCNQDDSRTVSIKRLQYLIDGTLRISSDNPLYESEIIDPARMGEQVEMIGMWHSRICKVV